MNRIIVAGAGGFLGAHLLKAIPPEVPVVALTSDKEKLKRSNPNRITCYDNEEFLSGHESLSGATLLNLAYRRSGDPEILLQNLKFTDTLLRHAHALGVAKIINISSQSVYCEHRDRPAREGDLVKATTFYDIGKYYLENWLADFSEENRIDYMNLRIASLAGPGFEQRITTRLIKSGFEKQVIQAKDNGTIFSYTHVTDMARGILAAARSTTGWNRVYNVGTAESYSIRRIVEEIMELFCADGQPVECIIERDEKSKPQNNSLDATSFEQLTGWRPEYNLNRILKEEYLIQKEGHHV